MKINLANIKKAQKLLNKRECVAIPTETVYGLAANGLNTIAVQKIFEKEDIFYRVKKLSKYFEEGLHSLEDLSCVDSIRNYGLLGGIDISMRDKPGKAGFNVYKKCYEAGVNIKPTGDALIIAPPFICEKKDIDEIIDKMRKGISNHIKS